MRAGAVNSPVKVRLRPKSALQPQLDILTYLGEPLCQTMAERTTIRLPEDLMVRAKRKAAEEGRTLTSLIEEGLRRVIADKKMTRRAPRVMPRVSAAKGGLLPGVDLTSFSALEEEEDLANLARLQRQS